MISLTEAGTIFFCLAIALYLAWSAGAMGEIPPCDARTQRRPNPWAWLGRAVFYVLIAGVLAELYRAEGWSLESVGVRFEYSPVLSLLVGVATYKALAWLLYILGKLSSRDRARSAEGVSFRSSLSDSYWAEANLRTLKSNLPRSAPHRWASIVITCALNPVFEELVYRGILVLMLAELVGSHVIAIGAGLIFCLAAHYYQGARTFLSHGLFYATVVGLLYSPFGLIAAIGCHATADLLPVLKFKSVMRHWQKHRRELRRQAIGGDLESAARADTLSADDPEAGRHDA